MGLMKKGSRSYTTVETNSTQFGAIVGQVNLAHQPPMVRIMIYSSHFKRNLKIFFFKLLLCIKSFSNNKESLLLLFPCCQII